MKSDFDIENEFLEIKESDFQKQIKDFVQSLPKSKIVKFTAGEYTEAGHPDLFACIAGHMVLIEVKREKGYVSLIQKITMQEWTAAGAICYTVRPSEFEKLKSALIVLSKTEI